MFLLNFRIPYVGGSQWILLGRRWASGPRTFRHVFAEVCHVLVILGLGCSSVAVHRPNHEWQELIFGSLAWMELM